MRQLRVYQGKFFINQVAGILLKNEEKRGGGYAIALGSTALEPSHIQNFVREFLKHAHARTNVGTPPLSNVPSAAHDSEFAARALVRALPLSYTLPRGCAQLQPRVESPRARARARARRPHARAPPLSHAPLAAREFGHCMYLKHHSDTWSRLPLATAALSESYQGLVRCQWGGGNMDKHECMERVEMIIRRRLVGGRCNSGYMVLTHAGI